MAEEVESQENSNKVAVEFKHTISKLVAILGSEKPLRPSKKVKFDDLSTIVEDLLAEEKAANKKEISDQLKGLLKGYTDLKSEVRKKAAELEKLEQEKMKEFNKAAKSLFERVEQLDEKAKNYYEGLAAASKPA